MHLADILMDRHAGPVLLEYLTAVGVDLTERRGDESPGAFKPEAKAPDPTEEIEDSKPVRHVILSLRGYLRPLGLSAAFAAATLFTVATSSSQAAGMSRWAHLKPFASAHIA